MEDQHSMPTKYEPKETEKKWYDYWVKGEFFKPADDPNKEPYSIVIPPPNVTGRLHLGHAWDATLQDILARTKRMQGYDTLWLPGMDHAGIATQAKVEGRLREEAFPSMILAEKHSLRSHGNGKKNMLLLFVNNGQKLVYQLIIHASALRLIKAYLTL